MHDQDRGRLIEAVNVQAGMLREDVGRWRCRWKLEKFHGSDTGPGAVPFEVIEREGNLMMYGGASALWHRLTGGTSVAPFDATNARLGVGDGTAGADPTHNDLQGTNKLRKGMDPGFPQHTEGTNLSAASVTFKATFGQGEANHPWQEWGLFNAATLGRMLNRRVEDLGAKSSAATWVLTVVLSLV
ncbi:hypothetical protein ACQP25_17190 [Microtetraspora malaysiensis]|uniref:hypothetical protein n=1 Tax=Microtetraspora malaysiensis TaxID=161358 RepID=UPI003D906F1E